MKKTIILSGFNPIYMIVGIKKVGRRRNINDCWKNVFRPKKKVGKINGV